MSSSNTYERFIESRKSSQLFSQVVTDSFEGEIATKINNIRLKSQLLTDFFQNYLNTHCPPGAKELKFSQLGKVARFSGEEEKRKLKTYLHSQGILNQILPDFSFDEQLNGKFCRIFNPLISKYGGKLFHRANEHVIQEFFSPFREGSEPHGLFYGYYLTDVSLDNIDELLIYIFIKEFILLNTKALDDDDTLIEIYGADYFPGSLGLLSKEFNSIFIGVQEVLGTDFGEDGRRIPTTKYAIYILLWSGEMKTLHSAEKTQVQKRKTFTKMNFSKPVRCCSPDDRLPTKYDTINYKTPQIPREMVVKLVRMMDKDLDNIVTQQDLKDYIASKRLISEEDYLEIFNGSLVRKITKQNKTTPVGLSIDDIMHERTLLAFPSDFM